MIEAFSYMFKDNKFFEKAGLYFLFAFLANFLTQYAQTIAPSVPGETFSIQYIFCVLSGFLLVFIPVGYGYLCIKALMMQKDNYVLPFFNVGKSVIIGLKFLVNMLALTCLFYLPFIILSVILGFLGALGGKGTFLAVLILLLLIYLLISLVFLLLVFIYTPVFNCLFAKKEWFTAFCRFIKGTNLIKQDAGTYFKGVGIYFLVLVAYMLVYGIFSFITMFLLGKTIISAILISFMTAFLSSYLVFVFSYIVVKAVKHENIE